MAEPLGTGVQLVSDGTSENTRVLLDGHPIHGITDITWRFSKSKRRATMIVELTDVSVDAAGEAPPEVVEAMRVLQAYNASH